MVGGIEGNPPGKWELIQKPLFPYKDQVPASSMADVWRELPECIAADDVTWAFLTMGKMGDMTKVSYGPSWNALQGFLNTNPTDALIYLRIWLEERREGMKKVFNGKKYPTPELHHFRRFESFDGDVSFEQVCRCGFHTYDDQLFMDHVAKHKKATDEEPFHQEEKQMNNDNLCETYTLEERKGEKG